ncbi:MAG: carotenoid biosynthesis protein [Bacteroidetes bacterium]|nr:MAG: carotenoid biosynthesis protein [Bacteroidota bacterium]TAG85478.1 MAG: carotenoid biosynthesis protein [Bacteroidota bacterium]
MQKYLLQHYKLFIFLLIVMHIAGIIGLHWQVSFPYFQYLIGFNLILTNIILFSFHIHIEKKFIIASLLIALGGFLIEVLGVHTGIIFGKYQYEWALGIKIAEVPLLIGLNWVMLIYCSAHIADFLIKNNDSIFLKSCVVATLMTFLDYFIEPFAIHFHLWQWEKNIIPVQNFMGWWFSALLLSFIFFHIHLKRKNYLAIPLYFIQLSFFFINYFIILYLK